MFSRQFINNLIQDLKYIRFGNEYMKEIRFKPRNYASHFIKRECGIQLELLYHPITRKG